jgi:hypothetical protein
MKIKHIPIIYPRINTIVRIDEIVETAFYTLKLFKLISEDNKNGKN